jgi:hypothetical protein
VQQARRHPLATARLNASASLAAAAAAAEEITVQAHQGPWMHLPAAKQKPHS